MSVGGWGWWVQISIHIHFNTPFSSCFTKHVKDGIKCRFGIPYFPMRKTMILEPFSNDEKFTKKEHEEISKNRQNVIKELDKILKDQDNSLTFEEFLKRAPNEIRINAYKSMIISFHKANMDIQFILDPYPDD